MNMDQMIYLYNDGREAFEARWDGKDYRITKDPLAIQRGIAENWFKKYPEANLRVEDIPPEEIAKRQPKNPLEDNDRGQAFAGLKRKRKSDA